MALSDADADGGRVMVDSAQLDGVCINDAQPKEGPVNGASEDGAQSNGAAQVVPPQVEGLQANGVPSTAAEMNGGIPHGGEANNAMPNDPSSNGAAANGAATNGAEPGNSGSNGAHSNGTAQSVVTVPTASLHGKVALITGAGRGIGRGCAIELGRRGCSVIVNYASSKSSADEVVHAIESFANGARAISIQADVSRVTEIDRLFRASKAHFGRLDIVMSNSGTESWDATEDVTEEKFDHVFNLNARAQFFVGQATLRYVEEGGRLVLMSSIAAGLLGVKNHALYNASKMAVIGMVKAFATDFGARGITVNGVAPGGIKSDMFTQNAWHYIPGGTPDWPASKIENLMAQHCPLGRCAETADVARVVAFLVSEDGGWVNGQVITISGGSSQ